MLVGSIDSNSDKTAAAQIVPVHGTPASRRTSRSCREIAAPYIRRASATADGSLFVTPKYAVATASRERPSADPLSPSEMSSSRQSHGNLEGRLEAKVKKDTNRGTIVMARNDPAGSWQTPKP